MNLLALLLVVAVDVDALASNAGAEKVERVLPGEKLIVHVLDYHIVNKELLGMNLEISGKKLDAEFAQVVEDASAVHSSKLKLLTGVKEVFIEGLTDKTNPIFKAEIKALKKYHAELKELSPDDGQDAKELIDEHRLKLLRLNAPGELLLDGVKLKVIPSEGSEYELARPKDGLIDDETNLKREESIINRIVKRGKTSLIILGGGHDLTDIIKKHNGWGYVRVTPKGYPVQANNPGESQ